ncbi:putative outer membrane usher protein LpfC' [compost metagenome]
MTRRGSLRYNLAAGKVDIDGQASPNLVQGTAVYGVSDNLTGYGGLLTAEKYHAVNVGAGFNTRIGGMSVDVTNSQSDAGRTGGKTSGQSVRFLYSKTLAKTDTTFTMVGYRYSTEGYRTLNQHVADLKSLGAFTGRQKSSFDMTINQTLTDRGSLYLGLGETSYWNRQGNSRRWQLGYSNSFRDLSYSLAMSKTRESGPSTMTDTQFTASISMPLGRTSQRVFASAVTSERGSSSVQAGTSGYLDEQRTLNYSVQGSHNEDSGASGSVGLGWDTPTSRLNANYSQGRDTKTMSLSTAGSVVMHSGGMTFGPPVGETFALIEVPDARGVGVDSYAAVRTDRNGYAVVPFVQPYRYNWVNLNTSTLGNDIEIEESSQMVVPTRGSVVKSTFAAVTGRRMQFELTLDNGKKIPFGAQAFDESGKTLGMVDNLSRLLVFGVPDKGRVEVRWEGNSCAVNYNLPPVNKELSYERYQAMCQAL